MKVLFILWGAFFITMVFGTDNVMAAGKEMAASIVQTRPVIENRRSPAILHLKHKGTNIPVMPEELEKGATAGLSLYIVDPALSDFHFARPHIMQNPGHYIFTLIPNTPCHYKVWAAVDTVHEESRFVTAHLPGEEKCDGKKINRETSMSFENNNYRFTLDNDSGPLQIGQETLMTITVREKEGRFLRELEPVMGGFAHITGFYGDYKTIADIEVVDEEPLGYYDLGGPTVQFRFTPAQEGFLKLFARFKVRGNIITVPFGLEIEKAGPDESVMLYNDDFGGLANDASAEPESAEQGRSEENLTEEDLAYERELEERARERNRRDRAQDDLGNLFQQERDVTESDGIYEDTEGRIMENMPELQTFEE